MKISEILKGCTPGPIQTVGMMQVIPLIGDPSVFNSQIASPDDVKVSTSSYGTLVFKNEGENVVLVPPHAAYVVKTSAQDHAMTAAGIVKAKSTASFNNAVCIQQSQPGTIQEGKHTMVMLPFPIREKAFVVRKGKEFNRLWDAITKLNTQAGSGSQGNLVLFFDKYQKELEHFIAEFELLQNQVGAIVLIGGNVVGVEMAPNEKYWSSIWNPLVRECYGSLAIMEEKKIKDGGKEVPLPKTRSVLRDATSVADLRKALVEATAAEWGQVETIVGKVCEIDVVLSSDAKEGKLNVQAIENAQVIGQIVSDGSKPVYASIISRETWLKNADWFNAEPFGMKK